MVKFHSKTKIILLGIISALIFSSCSFYKNVPYFQDLDSNQVKIASIKYPIPKIQKNDLLGIYISSDGGDAQLLFNTPASEANAAISANSGFLVNDDGEVQLSTLGKVKLEGLSTFEAENLLLKKVEYYVNKPKVVVRVLNFRISVTGDVSNAGIFTVPTGRINVMEAMAMAGDLRLTAKRENIVVIRHDTDETVSVGRLDLRSKKVFESPYFYLKNNDMIYVDSDLRRLNRETNLKSVGLVVSVVTALALLFLRGDRIF